MLQILPETAVRPFQGSPSAGRRTVGLGGPKRYFRESMATPLTSMENEALTEPPLTIDLTNEEIERSVVEPLAE
jgi:hypothetical protein